ncbi:class III lanthionine synthetase LanKC N-terminal domain-containing protein [Mycoplasma sp. 5912]
MIKIKRFYGKFDDRWDIYNDETFAYYKYLKAKLPDKGWKIHISTNIKSYNDILQRVVAFCKIHNISFKYIQNYKVLYQSLFEKQLNNLTGKFITIYPTSAKEAKEIIINLYPILKEFKAPLTYSDKQYKKSIIHYRYGSISKKDENEYKKIVKMYKPADIKDLFYSKPNSKIINGYNLIGLITFDSFSNIWLATKDKQKYVIKESKKYFLNGENLKAREKESIIASISEIPNFPIYVEKFWNSQSIFYVYKYCDGKQLDLYKYDYNLLYDINKAKQNKVIDLIDAFRSFFNTLKYSSVVLNDVKMDNFLYNEDKKMLYFVDLEHSQNHKSSSPMNVKNPYCNTNNLTHSTDKMKIFYMLLDFLFDYKKDSSLDPSDYLSLIFYLNNSYELLNIAIFLFKVFNRKLTIKHFDSLYNLEIINEIFGNKNDLLPAISSITDIFNYLNLRLIYSNFAFQSILQVLIDIKTSYEAKLVLEKWYKSIKEKLDYNLFYDTGNYHSPYLINGSAGILYILLFAKYKFNIHDFDEEIMLISNKLFKSFTRKIGLANGYAGILLVHYLYVELYNINNDKINKHIAFINICLRDQKIIDYDKREIDASFWNGYQGLHLLYKVFKYRKEKVEKTI